MGNGGRILCIKLFRVCEWKIMGNNYVKCNYVFWCIYYSLYIFVIYYKNYYEIF